jgi:hypothetical protein
MYVESAVTRPTASETCLLNRCLGMDYSNFQASWHTRCHANVRQLPSNRTLASRCPAMVYSALPRECVFAETLYSNGLFCHSMLVAGKSNQTRHIAQIPVIISGNSPFSLSFLFHRRKQWVVWSWAMLCCRCHEGVSALLLFYSPARRPFRSEMKLFDKGSAVKRSYIWWSCQVLLCKGDYPSCISHHKAMLVVHCYTSLLYV